MSEVHASLLAALIQAAWVTLSPTADDHCPSSAQVQAALEAHAPKLVATSSAGPSDGPLTVWLATASGTGELSLSLVDSSGLVKLYRMLPPPQGGRPRDCTALADTVALIVDRYFDEVELPAMPEKKVVPPPPPPPPAPPAPAPAPSKASGSGSEMPVFTLSGTYGDEILHASNGQPLHLAGLIGSHEFYGSSGGACFRLSKSSSFTLHPWGW